MIDCTEASARLETFLDRELNGEEVAEVQFHLGACPDCLVVFRFNAEVKRLVKVCMSCDSAPEGLRARVLSALHEA